MKIYLITDYKGYFGSKWKSRPYRSGLDQRLLADSFLKHGYQVEFVTCSNVFTKGIDWNRQVVLYTSSEEFGNNYKPFIEDIVCALEESGAIVVPRGVFLRAHNDKVLMELLREQLLGEELTGLRSRVFGTFEELKMALHAHEIGFPCVLKTAYGALSRGVSRADSAEELIEEAKKISRTPHWRYEIRDALRPYRPSLKGYVPESRHQRRFVVQPMIMGLDADWKVLVYGTHYYVLKRHVRPGDFRASGSHCNYLAGREADIPDCVLDMVRTVYEKLNVPQLSVDVAFKGERPYLIEFQCLHFGTSTQDAYCNEYLEKVAGEWKYFPKTMTQEEAYAYGVAHHLGKQQNNVTG